MKSGYEIWGVVVGLMPCLTSLVGNLIFRYYRHWNSIQKKLLIDLISNLAAARLSLILNNNINVPEPIHFTITHFTVTSNFNPL